MADSTHLTITKQRLFLFALVLLETFVGCLFLFWYIRYRKNPRVLGAQFVPPTIIRKGNLVFPPTSTFKTYYELAPNNTYEEQPWLSTPVRYTVNADGFNNSQNYLVHKDPKTFRIIALGDSFTYGLYVNTNESWPEQLEALLNQYRVNTCPFQHFEVLNAGVEGYDVPYIVEHYIQKGKKYQPDSIIWFESGSGFFRYNEQMLPLIEQCVKDRVELITDDTLKSNEARKCWDEAHRRVSDNFVKSGFFESILTRHYDSFFSQVSHSEVKIYTFTQNQQFAAWSKLKKRYSDVFFSASVPNISELHETVPDGHPDQKGQLTIAKTIFDDLQSDHADCFSK